jgi:FtsP/CotA-like multicopper oxidase with cupredoxin domain
MTTLIRRHPRRSTLAAITIVLLIAALLSARSIGKVNATSDGSPYDIPLVTDTNPDPTIVETNITAMFAQVNVGPDRNGVDQIANAQTFNGTIPGPTFVLNVGDTVIVHFENQLDRVTGIHWHGIELANDMDGTPFTQNQVEPGDTFIYKFEVTRPGIFWYHPHHHSSTNQVFKGLYGMILVEDPNEDALQAAGVLPSAANTLPLVLSDTTVCKAPLGNDADTYDVTAPTDPWVGPGPEGGNLPAQSPPTPPVDLCETSAIDEDGIPLAPPGTTFQEGDIPNIQKNTQARTNEGQTVLTNGVNVGGRTGSPYSPPLGGLAASAQALDVQPGQGLRLQMLNAATIRYFRLRLTDSTGAIIPLIRVGGEGGLLDAAVKEGGVIDNAPPGPDASDFDTKYTLGEIVLPPGSRADVVIAVPASATGVLTLWTEDYKRTGQQFSNIPTVPVMHLNVTGPALGAPYSIGPGTPIRTDPAAADPVEVLGAATGSLLNPASFLPVAKLGMSASDIKLSMSTNPPDPSPPPGGLLGIDGWFGTHDVPVGTDYSEADHLNSTRWAAEVGDTLQLSATNTTAAHHPWHLHGFSMQPISLTKAGAPTFTWPYAEYRDNIDVPAGYTLTFKIRLDDRPLADGTTPGGATGRWLFHCHIFFHATLGMLGELVVTDADGNERPYINADDTKVEVNHGDPATMDGTFMDPDGDPVSLSASIGTVTDNGDGTWTWDYTTGGADPTQFVYITATDDTSGLTDQALFQLAFTNTPPTLVLPGPQSQDYHDDLTFGISATDPDVGDTITLSVVSGLPADLVFTDNGDRTGTVSGTLNVVPGLYTVTFSADDGIAPPVEGTVDITVTKEETTLDYTGPTVILNGGNATMSALLREDGVVPIAGRTVGFTLGVQGCSGVTNASGIASCVIAVNSGLGPGTPITANFAGDAFYLPSGDADTALVFEFPNRGAFAVGNKSVAAGGTLTWWDSQWGKANDLTDNSVPAAFKGFAENVNLPTSSPPAGCAGPWTAGPATSPPPATKIPTFMGVLVTSAVNKSGNVISGNTTKIIVVKVKPGYAPNAGHAGTGAKVGVFCP